MKECGTGELGKPRGGGRKSKLLEGSAVVGCCKEVSEGTPGMGEWWGDVRRSWSRWGVMGELMGL